MSNEYRLDVSLAKETAAGLDPFTLGYIECLFWTLTDENGDPLDYLGLHDLSAEALQAITADCAQFQQVYAGLLDGADLAQAGHDYWLTRNRHGAGFWDRDPAMYPNDPGGQALTRAAQGEGSSDAYLGDDGSIYVS